MNKRSFFTSFRGQIVISLSALIAIVLWSEILTSTKSAGLAQTIQNAQTEPAYLEIAQLQITEMVRDSFLFFSATLVLVSGVLIYLIITLNLSLRAIMQGIQAVQRGELSYRINLHEQNEFGDISGFFDQAAEHVERIVATRTRELNTERDKLTAVISGINDAVIALNTAGNVAMVNPGTERLTGFAAYELLGFPFSEKILLSHKDQPFVLPFSLQQIATTPEEPASEYKHVRLSGKYQSVIINITVYRIPYRPDTNVSAIIMLRDMSREQELEMMKLDFVSMAAHELRTPLTAIRGYIDLLGQEHAAELTEDARRFVDRLTISAENLSGLIDNLLNVSRIETGKFTLERSRQQIVTIISGVIDAFTGQAHMKQQQLQFILPQQTPPPILIDRQRIGQVLSNLIANAINYTPPGGIITVTVTVTVTTENGLIHIAVKDTGQGIPTEAIPKLFSKFFRVSGALSQGSKGTGLGLYISKAILEMHGGTIEVHSALHEGSTFIINLPLSAPKNPTTEANDQQEQQAISSIHGIVRNPARWDTT